MNILERFSSLFKKKKKITPSADQFVDDSEPEDSIDNIQESNKHKFDEIYNYASTDFDPRGYDDALISMGSSSYKEKNLNLLLEDLSIKIERIKNHYKYELEVLNSHIQSRKDGGLIEIVQELENQKVIIEKLLEQIKEIEDKKDQKDGLFLRIKHSYEIGFDRGISDLSQDFLEKQKKTL